MTNKSGSGISKTLKCFIHYIICEKIKLKIKMEIKKFAPKTKMV